MDNFHMKAVIRKKREIAKGTLYVEYDLLGQQIAFMPGQYFHVLLREGVKHHFTIVNSPNHKGTVSQITRIRDSEFKQMLVKLPVGSEVEIYKIKGEFVLPEDTSQRLVFIALGIGITPYLSMLTYIQEEKLPFTVTLLYSDSDQVSMVMLPELKDLSKRVANFKLILTLTKDPGWSGEHRRIDGKFVKDYISNPDECRYYISGPPAAVEAVSASLQKSGIPLDNIKTENFTGY